MIRKFLVFFLILSCIYIAFINIAPAIVEKSKNKTLLPPPYEVDRDVKSFYNSIPFIADLHSDALLWDRNLTKRVDYSHVDIPRLIEANVALQVFTIVSKTPKNQNYENNTGETDNITLLNFAQGNSISTLFSLSARAWNQADKLQKYAAKSDGTFRVLQSAEELETFIVDRKTNTKLTSGILGVEGAHMLEGDLKNINVAFEKGIRIMAPVHFFDNDIGGSAHGVEKYGLTDLGRKFIADAQGLDIIIDLSHASVDLVDDILEISKRPLIVTHSGVKGTCNNNRNLSDDHLRKIAAGGGLIGIAMFDQAVCGTDVTAIANAIHYAVDIAGIDHVALGSDFDGAVTTPFDITGFPLLADALIKKGFSNSEISKIMGGNTLEFFRRNLPTR